MSNKPPLQQLLDREKEHIRKTRYDQIRQQNRPKPDYREVAKRLLFDTPSQNSQKEGRSISAYKELDEIQCAARMILELGLTVSVPTDVTNCACVHLYSFYKAISITEVDRNFVAVACLFLACKTEDHPRALYDLIIAAYNLIYERRCKDVLKRRHYLRSKINDLNLLSMSNPNSVGTPPSIGATDESESPSSQRSNLSDNHRHKSSPSLSKINVRQQINHITSPGAGSTGSIHGSIASNASSTASITTAPPHVKQKMDQYYRELKQLPQTRCLSTTHKRETVVPPDKYLLDKKPVVEDYEMILLNSIGFETYINLPHPLVVSSKEKFVMAYGDSMKPKIQRIEQVAYDLATRVVSLIPVQRPRNCIVASLIYLCGPFRHPVDNKTWWRDIYNADMAESELIKLSELICDAWMASRDYHFQVHEKPRMIEHEINKRNKQKQQMQLNNNNQANTTVPSGSTATARDLQTPSPIGGGGGGSSYSGSAYSPQAFYENHTTSTNAVNQSLGAGGNSQSVSTTRKMFNNGQQQQQQRYNNHHKSSHHRHSLPPHFNATTSSSSSSAVASQSKVAYNNNLQRPPPRINSPSQGIRRLSVNNSNGLLPPVAASSATANATSSNNNNNSNNNIHPLFPQQRKRKTSFNSNNNQNNNSKRSGSGSSSGGSSGQMSIDVTKRQKQAQ